MRVALHADFSRFTGYGSDGVDLSMALAEEGIDVVPFPRTLTPGLPEKFTRLLQKDPTRRRPDVGLVFLSPRSMMRSHARLGERVVGYTMWDRTPIRPEDFETPGDYDLTWLDRLAVTCPMNVQTFQGSYPDRQIDVVPGGIDAKEWAGPDRVPFDRPIRFLMAGSLTERKNPFALFEVWRELKATVPDFDAELVVHSTAGNLEPGIAEAYGPGVTITTDRVSVQGLKALYASCDVLVSPSRGEGNNRSAMEFMASGGPVIASDWSGNQNFMHRDVGWLVAGELVECFDARGAYWFEVDRDALAAALLAAHWDRDMVARKGRLARQHIVSFGWDVTARRMVETLAAARG